MRNPLTSMWGSLHEPRDATAWAVGSYAVAVVAGFVLLLAAPVHQWSSGVDELLRWIGALLLIVGGLYGAPTAWMGVWHRERVAAVMCAAGGGVTLFEVIAIAWPGPPDLYAPWFTVIGSVWGVARFGSRFTRVREAPFAPGRGPELPEEAAKRVMSRIIADQSNC